MKRILILLGLLVLSLSLIACGNAAVENSNIETTETANNQPVEAEATETTETTAESNDSDNELVVGKMIPNYELTTLEGDTVSLHDYDGKILILNFWATWWPYCNQEMPDLEKVNQMDDVQVLAIDVREPKKVVQDYQDEHGYDLTMILDEDGELADEFFVASFPTTYFVDEEGILLGSVPGMLTYEVLEELLEKIRNDEVNN